MTAISMTYTGRSFLIGADGRCKADEGSPSNERETDQAQKIFLIENNNVHLAYTITGFASNDEGTFQVAVEARKQAEKLQTERFATGHDYAHKFCLNIMRATLGAIRDGRIREFPANEHQPAESRARKFRLFFVGYFKGSPLWMEIGFWHDAEKSRIRIRDNHFSLDEHGAITSIGSTTIAKMMYNPQVEPDQRLASYKKGEADGFLEFFYSYLRACCDPAAPEIDPQCAFIGGHVHAAEITPDRARWLIEPLASSEAVV